MTDDDLVAVILANDGGTCHAFGHVHCYNDPTAKWDGRRCDQCKDWAARMLSAVVPPITAAISKAIDDVAFEVFIDTDGHRSIGVDINHEGLAEAAKIARTWKPGPPAPMRDKRPLEPEVWGIDLTEEESEAYWKTMKEMRGSDDGQD